MTQTEHKPELPAEVREAIINTIYQPGFWHRKEPVTELCAALAPLWSKPAPAPNDAEVAAAVKRLNSLSAHSTPFPFHRSDAADLRTVLAALADAKEDSKRLDWLGRRCYGPGADMSHHPMPYVVYDHLSPYLRVAIDAARAKEDRSHD